MKKTLAGKVELTNIDIEKAIKQYSSAPPDSKIIYHVIEHQNLGEYEISAEIVFMLNTYE